MNLHIIYWIGKKRVFKIISWNVNGFRSIIEKGYFDSILEGNYDIICLQEVKLADLESLQKVVSTEYYVYGNLSIQKGRNGVVVLSKKEADSVNDTIGHATFDIQGRYLKVNYNDFSIINLYMPHGGRDKANLDFKLDVSEKLQSLLVHMRDENVIIATDFNIARADIDVCRAEQNRNNIMFTPREREVVAKMDEIGFKDAFRELYPDKIEYTWWTYAFDCRERNIGWRIDYFFVSQKIMDKIEKIDILKTQMGSDHCPIILQM